MSHDRRRYLAVWLIAGLLVTAGCVLTPAMANGPPGRSLDASLAARLEQLGFTGDVESTLTRRLGRPLDPKLADTGRLLWFDTITSLNGDNACAGCHSPTTGFGDTQSIAIGIDSNRVVGPDRAGPRNQRRAPMVLNTAFFPGLMLNDRFSSLSGDPFDPSQGLLFPDPEGLSLSYLPHLLDAQAFIPPTERAEATGFSFVGDNDAIRAEVARRIDAIPAYRKLFAKSFPPVRRGSPVTFEMVARAIAEFELSLTFANAPIDRYARGERNALSRKRRRAPSSSSAPPAVSRAIRSRDARTRCSATSTSTSSGSLSSFPTRANVAFDGPARTRTSAASSSPATPPTATPSAPRPSATSRCSPLSCTTAPSRASTWRSATTSTRSPGPPPTTPPGTASTPILPGGWRPSALSSPGSIRSSRRRNTSPRGRSNASSSSCATACSTPVRGPSAYAA